MTASLLTVTRQVTSLLNAGKWQVRTTGAITTATGTLVCSDGAFQSTDVGKSIFIEGAGAAGVIYAGTISAYTSATQVTVTPVVSTTVAGASVSYGGQLSDGRRNLSEIREAIFEADEEIYLAIAETPGHWARPDLLTMSDALTYGVTSEVLAPETPSHIGDLGLVLVQTYADGPFNPGKPAEFEEILRYRGNTGTAPLDTYGALAHNVSGSQIGGYYHISEDGEFCAFSGNAMKVKRVPTYARGADLQSPLIFTGGIVSGALKRIMPKEGGAASLPLAQIHDGHSSAVLGAIRSKAKAIPVLETYEDKAA